MSLLIPATTILSVATIVGVVLLWIVAILGALVSLVVLLPTHVWARGSVDDLTLEGRAGIRWAWGVISVRLGPEREATLHLMGLRIWTFRRTGTDDKPDKDPKPRKKRAKGTVQWMVRNRRAGLRLMKRLLRTLRLRLQVRGVLGLDDPATTALVTRALADLLGASKTVSWQVEPDWLDERVQLDGKLRARIWPAHVGLVLAGGLLHRETRQMLRTAPRAGRKGLGAN